MTLKRVVAVYFSAMGNTKKVVEEIAEKVSSTLDLSWDAIDFTLPRARENVYHFTREDLVVFGVPTYAGRVPNKVLPFVQGMFRGQETPVVPVVTFGNRSFDSSLSELAQVLSENGFILVAAGAFACEHVFSEKIGTGRPDAKDWNEICGFAEKIAGKLKQEQKKCEWQPEEVKLYYTPLGMDGQPAKFLKAKPLTDMEKCDRCGLCAEVCPMGSIDPEDVTEVSGICIKCQACIRKCPQGAKYFADEAFASHVAMLEANYTRRAENAIEL